MSTYVIFLDFYLSIHMIEKTSSLCLERSICGVTFLFLCEFDRLAKKVESEVG